MKKILTLVFCLSVLLGANSCTKESPADDPNEIVFSSSFFSTEGSPMTKAATEVSSGNLNSFYVAAGRANRDQWSELATFTGTYPGNFKGSPAKYWWEESSSTYHFAASNVSFNHRISSYDNTFAPWIPLSRSLLDTDVVVAYIPSATWKAVNSLSFKHILARLGSVTISADTDYSISNIEIVIYDSMIVNSSCGYNIAADMYGGSFSSVNGGGSMLAIGMLGNVSLNTSTPFENRTSAVASYSIANSSAGTKTNDIYLFPGTYTVDARWTATKGASTKTYTSSTTVTLGKGEITNLSATLGGTASEIEFTVSLEPWESVNKTLTFPV